MRKVTLFATAIGLTLLISACGRYGFGCGDGWRPMMDFRYFGCGGMFMGMLLIVVLVAAAIYWFTREAKSKTRSLSGETSLDVLKKRYAGGEITKDEFERMKKDLEV
jgi:putative membrane protein